MAEIWKKKHTELLRKFLELELLLFNYFKPREVKMTRANEKGAWDFIEVGKIYQYKEDSLVAMVRILEDNSTEERYAFKIQVVASNWDFSSEPFDVSHIKNMDGVYSGMLQFYETPEYFPLPLGRPWPVCYEEGMELIGIDQVR